MRIHINSVYFLIICQILLSACYNNNKERGDKASINKANLDTLSDKKIHKSINFDSIELAAFNKYEKIDSFINTIKYYDKYSYENDTIKIVCKVYYIQKSRVICVSEIYTKQNNKKETLKGSFFKSYGDPAPFFSDSSYWFSGYLYSTIKSEIYIDVNNDILVWSSNDIKNDRFYLKIIDKSNKIKERPTFDDYFSGFSSSEYYEK
jgi:hypothetical protein